MRAPFLPSKPILLGFALTALLAADARAGNGNPTLIGWNNLGMHCMDDDYSVFSILPPFNTVDAQLIDAKGKLVISGTGYTLSYEAIADPDGSINRTSIGKTNFWDFVAISYGAALAPDSGLGGTAMPGALNTPQPMTFSNAFNWFEGLGIPIIPRDDANRRNPYPMMRLKAKNTAGTVVAQTDVVLPVSDEMDCRGCHASGSGAAARPAAGWVNDSNTKRDFRLNILLLHDEKYLGNPSYTAALAAKGFRPTGLFPTVQQDGKPILCALCHASEALGTTSAPGVPSLTASMHAKHATVLSPINGLPLNQSTNRSACYQCHPGSATRCLRGAMGAAVASDGTMSMQCQSCHGSMSQVGASTRTGWLDEPSCQNCHTGTATQNSGQIRFTSALDVNGNPRSAASTVFGTNPNTPKPGKSLYRFSAGHGGMSCAACHGSTHAEYPSAHRNDNIQSFNVQGHIGALADCTSCHATMPSTVNGGPHGMHPISGNWVTNHHDLIQQVGLSACQSCHGADYRGTVLSRAQGDRTFSTKYGTKQFYRGLTVGCYSCHNGIDTDSATTHAAPLVSNAALTLAPGATSGALALSVTGAGSTLRIVRQPSHGTVALSVRTATYFPEPGFIGPDYFTFAGRDSGNYVDSSNLGVVSITVGSSVLNAAGDGIPDLVKYALGLSLDMPAINSSSAPIFENVSGTRYLALALNRILAPPDVTLKVEVSADLKTWSPATVVTNSPTQYKARDSVPVDFASHRFIRLRVTRP